MSGTTCNPLRPAYYCHSTKGDKEGAGAANIKTKYQEIHSKHYKIIYFTSEKIFLSS